MGRRSTKIVHITTKDKLLLQQVSRTGQFTKEQAIKYLGYNEKRLQNMVKGGFFKTSIAKEGRNFVTVYKLAERGHAYVVNSCPNVDCFYHPASFHHDHELTEVYYNTDSTYLDSWRTEQDYKENNQHGSPDATYIDSKGRTIAVEVVTSSYTEKDTQLKHDFANNNGMVLDIHRC